MGTVTTFGFELARRIDDIKRLSEHQVVTLADETAQTVIDNGGYCDELTFAVAMYGGIDPDMNWGAAYENQQAAAPHIPDQFKKAQKLVDLVKYSEFQPYIRKDDSGMRDDIGIFMPGLPPFQEGSAVGYKIEQPTRGYYYGHIVVNALFAKTATEVSPNTQKLFGTGRMEEQTATGGNVFGIHRIGAAAVRRHLLGPHRRSTELIAKADEQIAPLVAAAHAVYESAASKQAAGV